MQVERASAIHHTDASVTRGASGHDALSVEGIYVAECYGPDGVLKWRDTIENTVMTEGKNLAFNTIMAGSSFTVTGPYMGLISAVSYSAISAADTGAQIDGTNAWKEAGGSNTPGYTGNRKTCAWSSASAGAVTLSAALAFAISSGTNVVVKGCFILFGTGALNTKDDAHGTLWSAGLFSSGDKTVSSGDTLNVSYSVSM